jgi:hypothetical protein
MVSEYTAKFEAIDGLGNSLNLLVKPNTDMDGTFRAWDIDEKEFIAVNGWNYSFIGI